MGLNELLFKRKKKLKLKGEQRWDSVPNKESSSDAPTESDDAVVRDPIVHVNSSATPSIELLQFDSGASARVIIAAKRQGLPAIVSPGPDLSDGNDPPRTIKRGPSEDSTDDDEHARLGFRLPDNFRNTSSATDATNSNYGYVLDNLFTAGHPSGFVDEDDSFYLSATDTEGGPSTLATEDRTVFPNLPSEDDFTASSRSASASTFTPLRVNPRTGAALLPESAFRSEPSRKINIIEDETNRQLREAVRQVLPVYPPYEKPQDESETESSADDEDSRLEQHQRRSSLDDDDEDSFYLSATDTEGPTATELPLSTSKTSLLPSLRLSSPTDSPIPIVDNKNKMNNHQERRTVASLMPELSAKSSMESLALPILTSHASIDDQRTAKSTKADQTLLSDHDGRGSNKSNAPTFHIHSPPVSPTRVPRATAKTVTVDAAMTTSTKTFSSASPLRKLPAPARDMPRSKSHIGEKRNPSSARCDDGTTDWFSFEGWADFGCSNAKPQDNMVAHQHKEVAAVEGLEHLVAKAKSKSKKTASSINAAPTLSRSSVREIHKLTCTDSVSEVIKSLESATSSRRSRSLSTSRLSPKRLGRSTSRPRRSKSSDRQPTRRDPSPGPFGIAADLESLSSQSNLSVRSGAGPSGYSHSKNTSHTSQHRSVSGESCHSSGHSTKSHVSHISESSKSIAADLIRLERKLETIGSVHERHQRSRRSRVTIAAPPGKLGVFLENRKESRGTVVTKVRPDSPLATLIQAGDRILAIDGADVSLMTVFEITNIMQRTNDHDRTLTVLKSTDDSITEGEV